MQLSALKNLTKTSKGFIALTLLALITACGGGGGGSSSGGDAGKVDKIAISYPANNDEVTDASKKVQLRYLTGDRDFNKLYVGLNDADVTAFFSHIDSQNDSTGPYVSLYALQALINEGQNTLVVRMSGSKSKTVKFTADLQKPELMITAADNIDPSKKTFDGFIRKTKITRLAYTTALNSAEQEIGEFGQTPSKTFGNVLINNDPTQTDDSIADISFFVTDDSTAIKDNGNKSELHLALPGREFQAASALQLNNTALDVPEQWIGEIAPLLIESQLAGGTEPLLNFADAQSQGVCTELDGKSLFTNPPLSTAMYTNNCQVFIESVEFVDAVVPSVSITGATTESVTFTASVNVPKVNLDVKVVVYDGSANMMAEAALVIPIKIENLSFSLTGQLLKDETNEREGLYGHVLLRFANYTLNSSGDRVGSNAVSLTKGTITGGGDGACSDINAANDNVGNACKEPVVPSVAVTLIADALSIGVNTDKIALQIDEELSARLFCDASTGGDPEVCEPSEAETARGVRTAILLAAEERKQPIVLKDENDMVVKTLATTTIINRTKSLQGIGPNAEATGVYFQMAASSITENKSPNGNDLNNADFNTILGSVFKPMESDTSLANKNLGSAPSDDVLIALPINTVNQGLTAAFQSAIIEEKSLEVPLSEFVGAGVLYDPNGKPKCVGLPKISGSDRLVFNKGDIELRVAPYIRLEKDLVSGKSYAELHVNGLVASAALVGSDDVVKVPNAANMELDVVARLELGLTSPERLPKVSIDASNISLYAAEFETFLDRKLLEIDNDCPTLTADVAKSELSKNLITENDLYSALPSLLGPVLDDLSTELIEQNEQIINLQGIGLMYDKRLEVVMNTNGFTVDDSGDYFLISANICDASENKCPAGAKGIYTLILIDSQAPTVP